MFVRNLMIFAAVLALGACSSEKDIAVDDLAASASRDTMTGSDMAGVYGEGLGAGAGTQADLVATVGDRVFFGYDRYDLTPEAQSTLTAQANWLSQYPAVNVTVEGHADERGTREYNLALGERRANSVRNYLTALGVDASRISTISYGKERPAVPGTGESAWSQNRRGVLVVE